MGKGLGGGTLHFGLQYIDTEDLIDNNFEEWKSHSDNNENLINHDQNVFIALVAEFGSMIATISSGIWRSLERIHE